MVRLLEDQPELDYAAEVVDSNGGHARVVIAAGGAVTVPRDESQVHAFP